MLVFQSSCVECKLFIEIKNKGVRKMMRSLEVEINQAEIEKWTYNIISSINLVVVVVKGIFAILELNEKKIFNTLTREAL